MKFIEGIFAKRLNQKGAEIPDPTPMAPPVGFVRTPSLTEQIREMIRSEKMRQEMEGDAESFEEADDFDVDDDFDPGHPYEHEFEPVPVEVETKPAPQPEPTPAPAPADPPQDT